MHSRGFPLPVSLSLVASTILSIRLLFPFTGRPKGAKRRQPRPARRERAPKAQANAAPQPWRGPLPPS
jgi:hypothetical protein